ncbi:hypothetical protein CK203_107759 [Vitis vinifera]|uniref:DUF4283 domain-containing protein n=1 Tax=Vitis vinifera TaxID=29760 RepID=A0A438CFH6_VITVI|nr:hypothetical protein CK203_107759 [Vitis vinifera]
MRRKGVTRVHARGRVLGAMEGSRLEDCLMSEDGTQSQVSGSGQNPDPNRSEDGLGLLGQASSSSGPKDFTSTGPSSFGLVFYGNGNGKPKEKAGPLGLLKRDGLAFRSSSPPASSKAQTEKGFSAMVRSRGPLRSPGVGISNCWGKDDQWGLRCGDETEWGGISSTDSALLEEDARYVPSSSGMVTLDPSPPFFSSFGRTPRKESFDRSGTLVESIKEDCLCKEIGHSQQFAGKCWDLVEISNDSMEDDRKALCLARPISQEEGAWVDEGWEESELARFSHFLGFSTEGLEKDILEFMVKIRREEKEFQAKLYLGMLRMGRPGFLRVCMEPFSKDDRDTFWGELGAIRGIWDDPCGEGITKHGLDWTGSSDPRLAGLLQWGPSVQAAQTRGGGRGRASFRVASKLKFLKDKIKSWNREVFGRVEVNKNLALQQVEFWDRVESGRSLTEN